MTELKNLVNICKMLSFDDVRNKVIKELLPTLKTLPSLNDLFTHLIRLYSFDDGKNNSLKEFIVLYPTETKISIASFAPYLKIYSFDGGREDCLKILLTHFNKTKLTLDEYNVLSKTFSFSNAYLDTLCGEQKSQPPAHTVNNNNFVFSCDQYSVLNETKISYKKYKTFPMLQSNFNMSCGSHIKADGTLGGNIVKGFATGGSLEIFKSTKYYDGLMIADNVIYYNNIYLIVGGGLQFFVDNNYVVLYHNSIPNKLALEFQKV